MKNNERVKKFGEVFTPKELVNEVLDKLSQDLFKNPLKTYLDPSCGDGAFLVEVLERKLNNGIDYEQALSTIYGVDILEDNVELCRKRLLGKNRHLEHIVEKNIVCADALRYHYRFDGTDPYKTAKDMQFDRLFG